MSDFQMTQELFSEILDERVTWRYSMNSCLCNGTHRFKCIDLFVIVYGEYKGEELIWMRRVFSLRMHWISEWWMKRIHRKEEKKNAC